MASLADVSPGEGLRPMDRPALEPPRGKFLVPCTNLIPGDVKDLGGRWGKNLPDHSISRFWNTS